MTIWQVDFYRRPLQDEAGSPLWELLICDDAQAHSGLFHSVFCPQPAANSLWLTQQIQTVIQKLGTPDRIQVFRPQSLSLVQAACQPLNIPVEATRRTPRLKQVLQEQYGAIALEKLPPLPLPENLWGDRWRFSTIVAQDLLPIFGDRMIPVRDIPELFLPVKLGLPSTATIPGVVIDGGRMTMQLARWIERSRPAYLQYIPGDPDGLILEAGLDERWVMTTFEDGEMKAAANGFRDRQQACKGLHFLLVQPDNSGMTYTGFWLLQALQVG
jgi:hypothetical protein